MLNKSRWKSQTEFNPIKSVDCGRSNHDSLQHSSYRDFCDNGQAFENILLLLFDEYQDIVNS